MSKPTTPREQFTKTKELFGEIRSRSGKNWKELYAWLETRLPGLVSGESNMRQLGSGHRYLTDEKLANVAKQALLEGYDGEHARAAIAYIPPTEEERKAAVQEQRRERYVREDPMARLIEGPMRDAKEERRRCAAALGAALSRMSPAGFSHADVLYMVQSWLIKNPPTAERGKRKRRIVAVPEEHGPNLFERAIFPESLPNNFALPEHRNGMPHFIECRVRPIWQNWNGTPPDSAADDSQNMESGIPTYSRKKLTYWSVLLGTALEMG